MIRISRPEAKREFQKTPAEIIAGVEEEPGGMKLHEVVRLINDIAARYEVAAMRRETAEGMEPVKAAQKGETVYLAVPEQVRRRDKVYLLRPRMLEDA